MRQREQELAEVCTLRLSCLCLVVVKAALPERARLPSCVRLDQLALFHVVPRLLSPARCRELFPRGQGGGARRVSRQTPMFRVDVIVAMATETGIPDRGDLSMENTNRYSVLPPVAMSLQV